MGYCLGDRKDCAVLNENILSPPCQQMAAFCILTLERAINIFVYIKRHFLKQSIGSHAFYMGHLYIIQESYR